MTRVQQGSRLYSQISSWQGLPWRSSGLRKTRSSNTGASGLIAGQRTKIACVVWQKKKKKIMAKIENRLVVVKGEAWPGSLGLVDASDYT